MEENTEKKHNKSINSKISDLFIKETSDSDESTGENNENNINFSSSDSEVELVNEKGKIKKSTETIEATNGIKLIDNISQQNNWETDSEFGSPPNFIPPPNPKPPADDPHKNITNMVENMLVPNNINGWDNEANTTIKNWYHTFKQQSYIYQWVLDNNKRMSDRLTTTSILTSSLLGIFTGFKLWILDDTFQMASNIILTLCNFLVALITAMSRKYADDKRQDSIRNYVREVDEFLGIISAQVLKSPIYRTNADDFFRTNNDKYTMLIMSAPNMSLDEISHAKKLYKIYLEHVETPNV